MSIKCLLNGVEVNYPCSPVCALFGDCVVAFEAQKKENVRTNADRIRAMSDEELADYWLKCTCVCDWCALKAKCDEDTISRDRCMQGVLEWLKQPAEE